MASKQSPLLSIIVPVFNEEKTLLPLLDKVRSAKLPGVRREIIAVDDGSTDRTAVLLAKAEGPGFKVFRHPSNRGKGAAIRTAIPHTKGDFVVIQDADLEYDPVDYQRLLEPLLRDQADVVYGSRFRGPHRVLLFWHSVGNHFLTFLTNILYNTILTDMETCYKAFRGELLRGLILRSDRFEFEPEVTAKVLKKGYRLFEVPIFYNGRTYQEGKKITWRDGFGAIWALLRYRFVD